MKGCQDNDVEFKMLLRQNICIHLKNGDNAKFIHDNELFDLHGAYNLIQWRGDESLVPTMIAMYCAKHNLPFTDAVNAEHTQEGARKMVQMLLLHMNGLPIPETILFYQTALVANRKYILENISFPIVVKTAGDYGQSVWKVNDIDELDDRIGTSDESETNNIFMIQEYIPNDHDFRVTMFDGEVLGTIKRMSKDGFYNNYSKGAEWEAVEISDEDKELSKKASEVCGIDIAGVDFVRTDNGIKFFEVNKGPMINLDYPEAIVNIIDRKYLK